MRTSGIIFHKERFNFYSLMVTIHIFESKENVILITFKIQFYLKKIDFQRTATISLLFLFYWNDDSDGGNRQQTSNVNNHAICEMISFRTIGFMKLWMHWRFNPKTKISINEMNSCDQQPFRSLAHTCFEKYCQFVTRNWGLFDKYDDYCFTMILHCCLKDDSLIFNFLKFDLLIFFVQNHWNTQQIHHLQ